MTVRGAIIGLLIASTIVAVPLQMVIEPSMRNTAAACIIMASSLSVLLYLLKSNALASDPLSSLALLGFCVTSQLGALIVQTTAWTAVGRSLYDPLYTFGTLAFYQTIALAVHAVFRFFSARKTDRVPLIRGLFERIGIYEVPSSGALWFMGAIGLAVFPVTHLQNIVGKVAIGFSFLLWAPFLILFYLREYGDSYCDARLNRALLAGYAAAAVLLGLALNTRAVMFIGVATIALLYVLAGMRSNAPLERNSVVKVGALGLILIAALGPVSDLATSMAIARQWRGKVSAPEMIKTTFHIMGKPSLIAAYRAQGASAARFAAYDEYYVANPLLNRLVATKYMDNALHFAGTIKTDDARARLREVSLQFVWGALPTPVRARLGVSVENADLAYSMGDYLPYLSRGIPLGSHRIGSMIAQGIALFGPFFPFLYAIICWILFAMMDLLTVRPKEGVASVAALGMLQSWNFFVAGISYEALHLVMYWLLRNFAQMVAIYVFVFWLARLHARRPAGANVGALSDWHRG